MPLFQQRIAPLVHRTEIGAKDGCLFVRSQSNCLFEVTGRGRSDVLAELHEAHHRINRTKSLPRSYVWWPRLDHEIENVSKIRKKPAEAALHPLE